MNAFKFIVLLYCYFAVQSIYGQANTKIMTKEKTQNNPLLCDPEEGICGIPETVTKPDGMEQKSERPVKIIYFTDPICSSCWGIEPQLRKLKLEYGANIEMEYRMGGLLPDWNYNSGGISKPSDVAHHWDEASLYYDMPIDGDVWLEDPLPSSYPPSIAFKAAQLQDKEKAVQFMRILREQLFLKKKNIAKWENIAIAANEAKLDVAKLQADCDGPAKILFEEDLNIARKNGVRGFPTLFFINAKGGKETVYGSKPYAFYEMAVLKSYPKAIKAEYAKNWETLFLKYNSLTAKEFSELSGTPRAESETVLNGLSDKGLLEKLTTKNGSLWTVK